MRLIEDHPMLGKELEYDDGKKKLEGKVTGVRRGGILTNRKTLMINKNTIRLRIKPADGSRAFWTTTMYDTIESQSEEDQ